MKLQLLSFSILVFLLACSEGKKENPTSSTPPAKKDSLSQQPVDNTYSHYTTVDISPMDMAYFPNDYPKLKMSKVAPGEPLARVVYSRPHLQGRQLFGEVLKYGEQWRLGANEATELEFFKGATIQGKKIAAGRYVLYCIPHKDKWTIVINSNIDSWGLQPDSSKDVARFDIPVSATMNHIEYFTMLFEKKGKDADLLMAWDGIEARLPIQF